MNKLDKMKMLFDIKDYIKFVSYEDLCYVLQNAINYRFDGISKYFYDPRLIIDFHDNIEFTVYHDGEQHWYKEYMQQSFNDKPAFISNKGCKRWFQNDELHRTGGKPAVIYENGNVEYWENGKQIKDNND